MNDTQLLSQISSLPDSIKREVLDFVEFLKQKSQKKSKAKERVFGYAKGYFKLSDNFDEPLEDFKDYK
ncbi:MAG: type II toxin-antitoxin system VapB family antitoxin, partial [Ginsengibacter sp.]